MLSSRRRSSFAAPNRSFVRARCPRIIHRHLKPTPQCGGFSLLHTLNLRRDAGVASWFGDQAERLGRRRNLRAQPIAVFDRGISVLSADPRTSRNVDQHGDIGAVAGGDSGASPGNRIGIPQEIPWFPGEPHREFANGFNAIIAVPRSIYSFRHTSGAACHQLAPKMYGERPHAPLCSLLRSGVRTKAAPAVETAKIVQRFSWGSDAGEAGGSEPPRRLSGR